MYGTPKHILSNMRYVFIVCGIYKILYGAGVRALLALQKESHILDEVSCKNTGPVDVAMLETNLGPVVDIFD